MPHCGHRNRLVSDISLISLPEPSIVNNAMAHAHDPDHHRKETVFIYEMSPQLEEELTRRAAENATDPAEEAADIIEQHIRETGPGQND